MPSAKMSMRTSRNSSGCASVTGCSATLDILRFRDAAVPSDVYGAKENKKSAGADSALLWDLTGEQRRLLNDPIFLCTRSKWSMALSRGPDDIGGVAGGVCGPLMIGVPRARSRSISGFGAGSSSFAFENGEIGLFFDGLRLKKLRFFVIGKKDDRLLALRSREGEPGMTGKAAGERSIKFWPMVFAFGEDEKKG